MSIVDKLAEEHIRRAQEAGEFDNLPSAGKPIKLDDTSMVPPELRAGYRLLKNAGYLPPELQLRKEIEQVDELIRVASHQENRASAEKRKQFLLMKIEMLRVNNGTALNDYRDKILSGK